MDRPPRPRDACLLVWDRPISYREGFPGVAIYPNVTIGEGTTIGAPSEVHSGPDAPITIGEHCDIASWVCINVSDSHKRCLGLSDEIERKPIVLEHHVFVGSHATILGGAHIGHHSVIAAGEVVRGMVPPWSLVIGGKVEKGYYLGRTSDETCDRCGVDGK